ncbi:MAG: Myo-inositol 2-dehydrogenase 1 [Candidatus Carbobacillus altaicus]|uniref:Myo-inositol 2-dehydrogenase 1 n=1 Tax=Candidatus Carbonibacillus altaicus TaxID=2163959 RepID=A0A2R6Y3X2_9BACL|nr:MAG: Myo-inositol 2-dehydrogenase 1 [Candidatus Carbobacillus altaicus]
MSHKVKDGIAVIGAGFISTHHLKAYAVNPDVKLVAIADLKRDRAQENVEQYQIQYGIYLGLENHGKLAGKAGQVKDLYRDDSFTFPAFNI